MIAGTPFAPMARHLRTRDAAAFLGVKPNTLRNWKAQRVGPPFRKLGTITLYDADELRAWLDARTAATHNAPASQAEACGEG
jgi:predicted DNA-binding transcriptional regulator AlpA